MGAGRGGAGRAYLLYPGRANDGLLIHLAKAKGGGGRRACELRCLPLGLPAGSTAPTPDRSARRNSSTARLLLALSFLCGTCRATAVSSLGSGVSPGQNAQRGFFFCFGLIWFGLWFSMQYCLPCALLRHSCRWTTARWPEKATPWRSGQVGTGTRAPCAAQKGAQQRNRDRPGGRLAQACPGHACAMKCKATRRGESAKKDAPSGAAPNRDVGRGHTPPKRRNAGASKESSDP